MTDPVISEDIRTLGTLLRRDYDLLQEIVYGRLASRGIADIRPAHSSLFRHIEPGGSRVTDLADRARMTKQSMAYLVEALLALGYVTMAPDPQDRRAKRVMLTERGETVRAALVDLSAQVEREAAALAGVSDLTILRRELASIGDAFEAIHAKG